MSNSWAQPANGYLQSLKKEAAGLKIDSQAESDTASRAESSSAFRQLDSTTGHAGAIEGLEAGLTIEQFEILLKHNYMGSYLFFKRLSDPQKNEVFEFYQQNPSPNKVREKILQVSKK